MIRATESEVLGQMLDTYRLAVSHTFSAVFDVLVQAPEEMTARTIGEALKASQSEMEAKMVAAFDQRLAELGDLR